MLVLAMEFSRGVQRPQGARTHLNETGVLAPFGRTSGRADLEGRPASLRRDGFRPGLLIEQGPEVTPSKRNSDARCRPQGPQPHGRDLRRGAVRQGRDTEDSE